VHVAGIEHDLAGDHADPLVRAVEGEHPLQPSRRLDRRVAVEPDDDLAGGLAQSRV
jgi:hypothetical protein